MGRGIDGGRQFHGLTPLAQFVAAAGEKVQVALPGDAVRFGPCAGRAAAGEDHLIVLLHTERSAEIILGRVQQHLGIGGVARGPVLPRLGQLAGGEAGVGAAVTGVLFLVLVVGGDGLGILALLFQRLTDPVVGDGVGVLGLVGLLVPHLGVGGVAQHAVAFGHLVDEVGLLAGLLLRCVRLLVELDRVEVLPRLVRGVRFLGLLVLGYRQGGTQQAESDTGQDLPHAHHVPVRFLVWEAGRM